MLPPIVGSPPLFFLLNILESRLATYPSATGLAKVPRVIKPTFKMRILGVAYRLVTCRKRLLITIWLP